MVAGPGVISKAAWWMLADWSSKAVSLCMWMLHSVISSPRVLAEVIPPLWSLTTSENGSCYFHHKPLVHPDSEGENLCQWFNRQCWWHTIRTVVTWRFYYNILGYSPQQLTLYKNNLLLPHAQCLNSHPQHRKHFSRWQQVKSKMSSLKSGPVGMNLSACSLWRVFLPTVPQDVWSIVRQGKATGTVYAIDTPGTQKVPSSQYSMCYRATSEFVTNKKDQFCLYLFL